MPTIPDQLTEIKKLRDAYILKDKANYAKKLVVQKTKSPAQRSTVLQDLAATEAEYRSAKQQLDSAIKTLQVAGHRPLTAAMNGAIPIVLLPVRLETRVVQKLPTDVPELWIRFFPDDIHANTHEPNLSLAEIEAGSAYWKTYAGLSRLAQNAETEKSKKAAWTTLKALIPGAQRSIWVAKSTRPLNWTNTTLAAPAQLQFPAFPEAKEHDWTRAPRTQALPDKFVVTIYKSGVAVFEQAGNVIPDTVFLGPDPFAAEDAFKKTGNNIQFHEDIAWLQDFDKATLNGLGMKIKLTPNLLNAAGVIERITAVGLLHSADTATGSKTLEELFTNHHYSSKGLSFIPQRTATNNTEADGSGYSRNEDKLEDGYYKEIPAAVDPNSDLAWFAKALGINAAVLKDTGNAAMKEYFNGLQMNTALYAATLSYFFVEMMEPAIKPVDAGQIRDFFTRFVSARGMLPSLRIGDQPYGFLVSSDLTKWTESATSKFYVGLADVLKKLQLVWDGITTQKVPRVGMAGDSSDTLLKIMGLQAGSVAFRQRLGNLPDFSYSLPGIDLDGLKGQVATLNKKIVDFLTTLGFDATDPDSFHPIISDLIFYNWTTQVPVKKLIVVDGPVPATEMLPKLPKSGLNYAEYLAKKAKLEELENVSFGGDVPPRTLLCLLMRHAMLTELKQASIGYYNRAGRTISSASFEKSLFNFNMATPDLTSFELLRGEPRELDDVRFGSISGNLGNYFLERPVGVPEIVFLNKMRDAMSYLSGLTVKTLENCLSEFIDLCSYRLDAWNTGLFSRRLIDRRAANGSGVYIGAYGWVENLKPETRTVLPVASVPEPLRPANNKPVIKLKENAGFTHVPSLNHATAMGLLLSGYKNHADKTHPDVFALNLSSQRTRRATELLDGVRNGQSIEVLLGYQFERALHDMTIANPAANLNVYILAFRDKYEVRHLSLPQQGAPEAQETVDAYPVVNGLKIIKATAAEINAIVTNAAHRPLVMAIKDQLADSLDACNDLLIAEGAYQITQGNKDRTAGVLNSALMADTPPEIQVLDTPRSSLLTYTHRITIHFKTDAAAAAAGWSQAATPRSAFEAGLNHWLGELIGDPARIAFRATAVDAAGNEGSALLMSLKDLDLQPIDMIYFLPEDLSGGATEFESRIAFAFRTKMAVAPEDSVKIEFSPAGIDSKQVALSKVFPLLYTAKKLITRMRTGDARDFASKLKTVNTDADTTGIAFPEWKQRIEAGLNGLKIMLGDFNKLAPGDKLPKDEVDTATMQEFFEKAAAQPGKTDRFSLVTLSAETLAAIIRFQIDAANYGIQLAYPENLNLITEQSQPDLLMKTFNIWKLINGKIKVAGEKLAQAQAEQNTATKINAFVEASKALLGDAFIPVPKFNYTNAADLSQSFADEAQLLSFTNTATQSTGLVSKISWLHSIARVRPDVAQFEKLQTMSEALGTDLPDLRLAQNPFRPADSWLGFEFPKLYNGKPFNLSDDTLALAVHGSAAQAVAELQAALVLDEWTEKIPVDEEITGITFHYNQPNAVAPQSVIVAVEPTNSGQWNWDVLQGVVNDTLRRAKSRAVEPDQLMEHETLKILLPMTIASFDVNEANISLDYLSLNDQFMTSAKAANLALYKKWN